MHHVTAIFSDPQAAERAVRSLVDSHFNVDEISVVVSDREGPHDEAVEYDTGVAEGATGGALVGGVLGILGASLVATGVVVSPGLAVFATGPLLAAIKGAVAGAAVGLGVGAVGGLGFWKDETHIHAKALEQGGIVVAVPAEHEHADHARQVFSDCEAEAVQGLREGESMTTTRTSIGLRLTRARGLLVEGPDQLVRRVHARLGDGLDHVLPELERLAPAIGSPIDSQQVLLPHRIGEQLAGNPVASLLAVHAASSPRAARAHSAL